MAERELRGALGGDPHDPAAHALLGLCLVQRRQFEEATREAGEGIRLAPGWAFPHYVMALVLADRNQLQAAEQAAQEAIRLDPANANYLAALARVRLARLDWRGALDAAEQALARDPEHVESANLRAYALVQLGRRDEAGQAIDSALARDPENAFTHANNGWARLHAGDHRAAREHFREALRLDPELDWARQGMIESLKAGNPLYGLMLRYFLWVGRLSRRAQWTVVLGGYFGFRLLGGLAADVPASRLVVVPLLVGYALFVLLTWIANPLFNLLLRLSRFGRLLLDREQLLASNIVGACLLGALLAGLAGLVAGNGWLLLAAASLGLLTIPVSAVFACDQGWPRVTMATYAAFVAVLAVAGTVLVAVGGESLRGFGGLALVFALLGALLATWAGNLLMARQVRR
jgi:tetratricopeptide (TPR) repeat protein